jgi:hypothetical protein
MPENRQKTDRKAPKTAFKQGVSGNPGGRPKRTAEEIGLISACKDKTQDALDVLLKIMSEGENERNKITAALAIIERGHGKAVQPTTLSGPNGGPVEVSEIKINLVRPSGT